jgi:hypothetical protein
MNDRRNKLQTAHLSASPLSAAPVTSRGLGSLPHQFIGRLRIYPQQLRDRPQSSLRSSARQPACGSMINFFAQPLVLMLIDEVRIRCKVGHNH